MVFGQAGAVAEPPQRQSMPVLWLTPNAHPAKTSVAGRAPGLTAEGQHLPAE
jgi:hypothetical protein